MKMAGSSPLPTSSPPSTSSSTSVCDLPKVGAAYNVFDGEELLESSIRSIRRVVSFVVVVYQSISNAGQKCDPGLLPLLERLKEEGLVDEVVEWEPKTFSLSERVSLVSDRATGSDLGGARAEEVSGAFFNEMQKRELGRKRCLEAGCRYFMALDVDECYKSEELSRAVLEMERGGYEAGLCLMWHYFRDPRWRLCPTDGRNWVSALFRCDAYLDFRLCHPYPVLLDPTRRLRRVTRVKLFAPHELLMHHFSWVRKDIVRKLTNVTNATNYDIPDMVSFSRDFSRFKPTQPLQHPHPGFQSTFSAIHTVPNTFHIPITHPDADSIPEHTLFITDKATPPSVSRVDHPDPDAHPLLKHPPIPE